MKDLTVTSELINLFEKATGLTFINENEANGNVCFANNPELRPDFKTTFTIKDIKNYLLGLKKTQNITGPNDAEAFWKIVGFGKGLKDVT